MAIPILFFPASFLTSLSTMLIPEMSEANAIGNKEKIRRTVDRSISITLTLSIFVSCVFFFNAHDIANIIYNNNDVGKIIKILSPIIPFMYLESVCAGMLKGLNKQVNMFKYNLLDSCLRIIAVLLLLPRFGIKGYLIIMIFSNVLTSTLNSRTLIRSATAKIDYVNQVFAPLFVSLLGGFAGNLVSKDINILFLRTFVSICIQSLIFVAFLFLKINSAKIKTLTKKELQ
jgi:stage V sporulation protein B